MCKDEISFLYKVLFEYRWACEKLDFEEEASDAVRASQALRIIEAKINNPWSPIELAPKTRPIIALAVSNELEPKVAICKYDKTAGFEICTKRKTVAFQELKIP